MPHPVQLADATDLYNGSARGRAVLVGGTLYVRVIAKTQKQASSPYIAARATASTPGTHQWLV